MKNKILLLWLFIFIIPMVSALPLTSFTAIDEDSAPYTAGNIHYGDFINASLSCVDCISTYYCLDTVNSCSPDILYEESIQFLNSRYFRYYSTDGAVNETTKSSNVIINTEPEIIDFLFVSYPSTINFEFQNYDAEDNIIINRSAWFVNGIEKPNFENLYSLNDTEYVSGDSLNLIVFIGDLQYNTTPLSLTAIVDDFLAPVIVSYESVPDTITSAIETLQVTTVDNSDIKEIKHYFTQPNGTILIISQLITEQSPTNIYSSLYTFSTVGEWVYNKIETYDVYENKQTEVINDLFRVYVSFPSIGGGGGSSNGGTLIIEEDLNISQFYINPSTQSIYASAGSERFVEIELVNTYVSDINVDILINQNKIASEWMSFSDAQRIQQISIEILKQGGISGNSRFITYYLDIPENTPDGLYDGEIIVTSGEEEKIYAINVRVGSNIFLEFFTKSLYQNNSVNITYGLVSVILFFIIVIVVMIVQTKNKTRKVTKKNGEKHTTNNNN